MKEKIVKRIPTSENGSVLRCFTKSGKEYLITNNPMKKTFTLWQKTKEGYLFTRTAKTPLEAEKSIDYNS